MSFFSCFNLIQMNYSYNPFKFTLSLSNLGGQWNPQKLPKSQLIQALQIFIGQFIIFAYYIRSIPRVIDSPWPFFLIGQTTRDSISRYWTSASVSLPLARGVTRNREFAKYQRRHGGLWCHSVSESFFSWSPCWSPVALVTLLCGLGVLMPVLDTVWTGGMGRRMKIRSRRDAKVQGESGNENETATDKWD